MQFSNNSLLTLCNDRLLFSIRVPDILGWPSCLRTQYANDYDWSRMFSEARANQSAFAALSYAGQLRAMDAFAASPPAPAGAAGVSRNGRVLAPVVPGNLAFVANEARPSPWL